MNPELDELTADLAKAPGASVAAIRERERELGIAFPADYVEFLQASKGAEGFVGGDRLYVRIDPIEEMMSDRVRELLKDQPGLIVFGSDGGGEAFAFDARGDEVTIVMFPWIGLDDDQIIPQGRSFTEFLRHAPIWRKL